MLVSKMSTVHNVYNVENVDFFDFVIFWVLARCRSLIFRSVAKLVLDWPQKKFRTMWIYKIAKNQRSVEVEKVCKMLLNRAKHLRDISRKFDRSKNSYG